MYFQDVVLALQKFWSDQGCIVAQSYDIEKGAATFSPLTFLRSLGPEPFRAAYIEPCRRPTDGRYGENPLRLQQYYQFQVVMKPNPQDLLELYIESLAQIGITSKEHDIRFVHDDWESPTLGAWGLGWEIWLDGMEITQFTYFQQVGGIELSPIMGEITYGLERLCMFLQNVDNVYNLKFNSDVSYGDLFHQNEVQFSKHNFELSDISLQLDLFKQYESECQSLCQAEVPAPALDFCLKASHAFNLLDARGAISVKERQGFILRVRKLAREVAKSWYKNREELGFPLHKPDLSSKVENHQTYPFSERKNIEFKKDDPKKHVLEKSCPFLLEVGVEEMPAQVFASLLELLPGAIKKLFRPLNLEISDPHVFVTPRRIVISIDSILEKKVSQILKVKGPPLKISQDVKGQWLMPAIGFAKKNKIDVSELKIEMVKDIEYIFAVVDRQVTSLYQSISELVPKLLGSIQWYKTMRWGTQSVKFVRPVKWLMVLIGDKVVETQFAGIQSSKFTYGHRFLSPSQIVPKPYCKNYKMALADAFVIVDHVERQRQIASGINHLASQQGLVFLEDRGLLEEVTHLIEFPVPVLCEFHPDYLNIPEIVLVSEMKGHQKYFPLHTKEGKLSNFFVAISNTQCKDSTKMKLGYERVLRSRFSDAEFFLKEDLKFPLEERVPKLSQAIFQEGLGTVLEKVERIKLLSIYLATCLKLSAEEKQNITTIAYLSKADLNTKMVGEFPDLQGEVGRYYAEKQGHTKIIYNGILEHYFPRTLNDDPPSCKESAIVGIADRIDSIVGIFLINRAPTSSADPFAIRRACLTAISTIILKNFRLNLSEVIKKSLEIYKNSIKSIKVERELEEKILDFFYKRISGCIQDRSHKKIFGDYSIDLFNSAIQSSTPWYDLVDLLHRIDALNRFKKRNDFEAVAATFKRANNILKGPSDYGQLDPGKFVTEEEKILWEEFQEINDQVKVLLMEENYFQALVLVVPIRKTVDRFFEFVLINDPDLIIRQNRQCLIWHLVSLLRKIADFSCLNAMNDPL